MKRILTLAGVIVGGALLWYGAVHLPGPSSGTLVTTALNVQDAGPQGPAIGSWGFDIAGMDRNVRPGEDFFRYANGAWFDKAVIPDDRASTGSFLDLSIRSEEQVQAIIDDLDRKAELTDIERKVRDLYHSFVGVERLEELGLAPAQGELQQIAAATTHENIAALMGSVPLGTESIFGIGIGIDDKDPDKYAIFAFQAGLGLPDRDYYLLTEQNIVTTRNAYRDYVANMLTLGGIADAQSKAAVIFALETEIARIHWPSADRREVDKIYNPMTVSQLKTFAPQFPWDTFFAELGIKAPASGGDRQIIVAENTAFPPMAALFARTPVAVWRDYLTFHYLDVHATYLPKRFDDARFDFRGKILAGQAQQLDRGKRGVQFLNRLVGEAVGQIYVTRYFPPSAKAEAERLVGNLMKVYQNRIQTRDWMGEATRSKALEKAGNFTVKIGYPDNWRDYTNFEVVAGDLFGNNSRGTVFEWNRELTRIDDPVDRGEWGMSPQTVNAYYNASLNEIVFPAAILQAPFFDPNADDAINYGGIGAVIGHEISHGFDDQGSKYDARGILENWWTDADRSNFEGRTTNLVGQFNAYSPLEGLTVNGRLTLGENIADLAGLAIAHAAYRLSLGDGEGEVLDGFTPDQRVFLGNAQVWRFKSRDADMRRRVLSDPHSPPQFRVNGAVRNVDAWYEAFRVVPGDPLYISPEERVRLW
jgi:putative endopeptidase